MLIFFFKQKTAYEMRISDWSSSSVISPPIDGGGSPARLNGLGRVATIAHPKVAHRVAVAPGIGVGRRLLRQIGHDRKHILGNNGIDVRPEEHTTELQSLMRTSSAVYSLTKKNRHNRT